MVFNCVIALNCENVSYSVKQKQVASLFIYSVHVTMSVEQIEKYYVVLYKLTFYMLIIVLSFILLIKVESVHN